MSEPQRASADVRPLPLVLALGVVLLQAAVLVGYAVLEAASVSADRATMGVTTALFFAVAAAGLAGCAWAVYRGQSWGRSPLVLAQLIALGLAWSFRGGSTTWVAVALLLTALVALVGVLHPASIAWLARED